MTELTLEAFLIILALLPNYKVEMVSSILSKAGDAAMIRVVFELPPKESYNILVNLESR
jgi:hypothetical protein